MKFNYYFIVCFALVVLVSEGFGAKWNKDDEEALQTNLELDEYDFEDVCGQQVVQYEWNSVIGNGNSDKSKSVLENFAKNQMEKANRWLEDPVGDYPARTEEVARKLELISRPGDVILPQEKYSKLLTFESDISKSIANRRIECEKASGKGCKLTSRDPEQLLLAWKNMELFNSSSAIPIQYPDILQLLTDAAKANGFSSVRSYWLMLSELEEDGYEKANALWAEIRPFYQKCHTWVAKHLRKKYGSFHFEDHDSMSPETAIPSYLLGSTLGMDWTNIADLVFSKECLKVNTAVQSSVKEKKLAGKELYQMTEKMTDLLHVGKLPSTFWKYSLFNQSCPSKIVDPCKQDLRVATCNQPSWSEYLNAHEVAMQGVHSGLSDSLSYMLKNGNRYSALDKAIAGLGSVVASNRHYVKQQNMLNLTDENENCMKNVLLILLGLRELPKLPYYLVADKARLQAIENNDTSNIANIWSKLRLEEGLSQPEDEWWGFLEDSNIALNRPYISEFFGIFIKFQLFEEMIMRDEAVSADSAPFIAFKDEFRTLLGLGNTKPWPALLEDTFKLNSVSSAPLLRFFSRLDALASPESTHLPSVPKPAPTAASTKTPTVRRVQPVLTTDILPNQKLNTEKPKTEHPEKVTEESGGVAIGTILFILCAILMGIALIAAIVNYSRKRFSKSKEYQRPPENQPV